MVVNGSCESDWPEVLALAQQMPEVVPSFGYHPWHLQERTPQWRERLVEFLAAAPSAVGEIGLDRWIPNYDFEQQQRMFTAQMTLAAERDLPASIHCLKAWGRLLELLRKGPRPACGFLLHSYGGPREMVEELAALGAYFSFPGYFAHERKAKQREAFAQVPLERLLIETDAPDQLPPDDLIRHSIGDPEGKPINHPANLAAIYEFTAAMLGVDLETLAIRLEENFLRLFGGVLFRAQKAGAPEAHAP
jgi:TatD DNase family protein